MSIRRYAGLCLLGVSLACKHDLIFLPLWLAMVDMYTSWEDGRLWIHGTGHSLLCVIIPYSVFGLTFVPFIFAGDGPAIWRKVVGFKGFANAPFWFAFVPGHILDVAPPFALFIGAMLAAGWIATRER